MGSIKKHLKEAFCVITATGVPGVVSKYFSRQDLKNTELLLKFFPRKIILSLVLSISIQLL